MRLSCKRQSEKDIAKQMLSNPNFSETRARKNLENYGLTLASYVCEGLKKDLIPYNSPHYLRILDTLYDHFEKYEVALGELDIMVREVEKVLYEDVPLDKIIRRQKAASDEAFKREIIKIKSLVQSRIKKLKNKKQNLAI